MTLRRGFQVAFLLLFVWLLFRAGWPPSAFRVEDGFLRIDPLIGLQAWLASRQWVQAAGIALFMLGLALILGRFFCGWICPFGTLLDVSDRLWHGKAVRKRRWLNDARRLRWLKTAFLLVIAVAALFGQGLAYLLDPICWTTRLFTYAVWPVAAIVGNLGLEGLRPVFEWLGWMGLARADLSQPVFGVYGVLTVFFFTFVFWLGRYQKRFWCRNLCPLGALYGLFARFAIFRRTVGEACDGDGRCHRVCPTGAILSKAERKTDMAECIQCGDCAPACHLNVTRFEPAALSDRSPSSTDLDRRRVLFSVGGGAFLSAWLAFEPGRKLLIDNALRPPGALPETEFLATCVRCGQCVKVCPTHCLQPGGLISGMSAFLSPVAVMRLGPCDPNCNACGGVCPTGAIRHLELSEKPNARIGNAVLDRERCVVWEQGRACLVCDENCPYGAISWKADGADRRPYVDETRCNGCGQCEAACPVPGSAAIRVHVAGQVRLSKGPYPPLPPAERNESGSGYPYF